MWVQYTSIAIALRFGCVCVPRSFWQKKDRPFLRIFDLAFLLVPFEALPPRRPCPVARSRRLASPSFLPSFVASPTAMQQPSFQPPTNMVGRLAVGSSSERAISALRKMMDEKLRNTEGEREDDRMRKPLGRLASSPPSQNPELKC